MALPTIGLAWYNGHTFGPSAYTTDFTIRPVEDAAGRTFAYSVVSITITEVLAGQPSDAAVQRALSALTQPAAGLIYNGRGTSGVNINLGGLQDVLWGPKPRILSLKPLGGGNAVRIRWTVEFATLTCGDAQTQAGTPIEFVYRLSFVKDQSGYSKRTYSGHVRIAQTRRAVVDRRVLVSADEWRERIVPPLLQGFRRTSERFNLDESKCRLDFEIIDDEFGPNVPPPGVIKATATHRYTTPKVLMGQWTGTFDAEYEIARGAPVSAAHVAWAATIQDRIATIRRAQPTPTIIPTGAEVTERELYDKTIVRLSVSYVAVAITLPQIINQGGLWRPVPAPFNNWKLWAASIPLAQHPRGYAQLQFSPGDDAIVDACRRPDIIVDLGGNRGLDVDLRNRQPIETNLRSTFPPPTPQNSYMRYVSSIRIENDQGNVLVKTLPGRPLGESRLTSGVWDAELRSGKMPTGTGKTQFPPASDVRFSNGGRLDTVTAGAQIQQRVSPQLYVYLQGEALRAGYPIPVPAITNINGVAPVNMSRPDMGEYFTQGIVGTGGTVPIYGAMWCLRYAIDEPSAGAIPIPPNPLMGSA